MDKKILVCMELVVGTNSSAARNSSAAHSFLVARNLSIRQLVSGNLAGILTAGNSVPLSSGCRMMRMILSVVSTMVGSRTPMVRTSLIRMMTARTWKVAHTWKAVRKTMAHIWMAHSWKDGWKESRIEVVLSMVGLEVGTKVVVDPAGMKPMVCTTNLVDCTKVCTRNQMMMVVDTLAVEDSLIHNWFHT